MQQIIYLQNSNKDTGGDIKVLKKIHNIKRDNMHEIGLACGYCEPCERKVYVTVDGSIYPCEKVDEVDNYKIGDVYTWVDEEKLKALLEQTYNKFANHCSKCWACRICPMCYATEKQLDKDGEYCRKLRDKVEEAFKIYLNEVESNIYFDDYMNNVTVD